jgi:hypothetical protein
MKGTSRRLRRTDGEFFPVVEEYFAVPRGSVHRRSRRTNRHGHCSHRSMRRWHRLSWVISVAAIVGVAIPGAAGRQDEPSRYRTERARGRGDVVRGRFAEPQVALLEKLNRADRAHLDRLPMLVVPVEWGSDELTHSSLPARYEDANRWAKLVVAHLPGQVFGAYEYGVLAHWGPISSGRRTQRTRSGLFALNWRSPGRASTVDPDWFMRWYFNFDNREGLALHANPLPGYPASHGCIRLLERDARWLYDWGQGWTVDGTGTVIVAAGTPVLIVGQYDFDAPPPWRSLSWLARPVTLPVPPAVPGT